VLESAEAMGMTRAQILFRSALPACARGHPCGEFERPTIITIGVATIAAASVLAASALLSFAV